MKRLAIKRVEWRRKHRPRTAVCPNFMKGVWFVIAPNKKAHTRLMRQWATLTRDRVTSRPMLESPDRVLAIADDLSRAGWDIPSDEAERSNLHAGWGWKAE